MSSEGLHEATADLSDETRDFHRAISSLREELEAVDWYQQRADACKDEALREILLHNMREEIEHSAMVLEWLRRNHPDFHPELKDYVFTRESITDIEHNVTGPQCDDATSPEQPPTLKKPPVDPTRRATIGSLRNVQ